jgi:hypothetical protein
LFLNQFNQPTSTTPSSQTIASSGANSSIRPSTSSQGTTSISTKPFVIKVIANSKWVCKKHLGNPFTKTLLKGKFLIPLDDESFDVSNAIAPYLQAKVLACSDLANNVFKFSYSGNPDSKALALSIYEFTELVYLQFKGFARTEPEIILITAKPIIGNDFLTRALYRREEEENLLIISTAALKPKNYKTSQAAKTVLFKRIITIVQKKLTIYYPNMYLEDLDKLWRK